MMNIQTAGIGDYLFLILVVAAAVVQLIGKNRKKAMMENQEEQGQAAPHPFDDDDDYNQVPKPQRKPESPFGPFFDQFDDMLNERTLEPEAVVTKPVVEAKKETRPVEKLAEKYNSMFKAETGKMFKEGQPSIDPSHKTKVPTTTLKQNIRHKFNARQAVIYSEILNRKY